MPTYPNFPSAYQYDLARDGSWVFMTDNNGVAYSNYSVGEIDSMTAWSAGPKGASIGDGGGKVVALFPVVRQISGVAFGYYRGTTNNFPTIQLQYSLDTTNGNNGVWTTITSFGYNSTSSMSATLLRTNVFPVSASGVKSVRLNTSGGQGNSLFVQNFIIWGTTQPTGLVFWYPSSDIPLLNSDNNLDRGDIYTNAAPVVQQVRVKNTGAQTANNVVVSTDTSTALTTLDTDTTFSLDGTNFAATQTIASIAPGAISAVVYVKRGTPTDAAGTTRNAAMRAVATTWT